MNEVETLMSLEDLGHDLSSVKFLLKKHQGVEADIEVHDAQIQSLCDQAQVLIEDGHFDAGKIEQATENVLQRCSYFHILPLSHNIYILSSSVTKAQIMLVKMYDDLVMIKDRVTFFLLRFDELKELSSNRQSQLEDSLGLHQFFYDIEMEMAWIREHMTMATSEDLGTSLIGVQRLRKRHLVKHFFFVLLDIIF